MNRATSLLALAKPQSVRSFSTAPPAPKNIEIEVNGKKVKVKPGVTILQACATVGMLHLRKMILTIKIGVEIPRFCYHEKLSIAGNCRMCLVEVAKSPKPVASCAMPVVPGMKVNTNTNMVKKGI